MGRSSRRPRNTGSGARPSGKGVPAERGQPAARPLARPEFRWGVPLAVTLVLIVLVVAVFAPLGRAGFVSLDDSIYFSENPHVVGGITWPAVAWAFTTGRAANWHPVTWLSHMLDAQLFGIAAGPAHVVNVALHALNTGLLFLALWWMTGRRWPSALVAALFGVHPLHVESVAWISERKDVLSTAFWMLTLLAYTWYVKTPRRGARRAATYGVVVVCLALGLMAKPMLVTLPFVLLLLDAWPFERLRRATLWPLVLEKLPLFALSLASSVVTFIVQRGGGAMGTLEGIPLGLRAGNAVVSAGRYLIDTIWPTGLAVLYPLPHSLVAWQVAAACCAIVAISALAARFARQAPYLLVGWLWYLGTLVPVLGLVSVGVQARADRYTYVPLVGIFVMVAFVLQAATANRRRAAAVSAAVAAVAVAVCAVVARAQVDTWKDDETLLRHTLDVTRDNAFAENELGKLLYAQGRPDEAAPLFVEAARLAPSYYDTHHNLGMLLASRGQLDQAIAEWREEVRLKRTAEGLTALAAALYQKGNPEEALANAYEAVTVDPELPGAQYNLGLMLLERERFAEAGEHFRAACRLQPSLAVAHEDLGQALARMGDLGGAVAEFGEAVRLAPRIAGARHELAAVLLRTGRREDAIREYAKAVALEPGRPDFLLDLGSALAEAGRFAEAVAPLAEAVRLDPTFEAARYHYGLVLASAGRFGEAADQLAAVVKSNPADEDARRALAALAAARSPGRR